MAGRKPLLAGQVDGLDGSQRAKQRLRVFLWTLGGTLEVAEACEELDLRESQFHELRHDWLQGAVQPLEPRRLGRPPRVADPRALAAEVERLADENAQLKSEATTLQVRAEC